MNWRMDNLENIVIGAALIPPAQTSGGCGKRSRQAMYSATQ